MDPIVLHHVSHSMLIGIAALVATLSFAAGVSFANRRSSRQTNRAADLEE